MTICQKCGSEIQIGDLAFVDITYNGMKVSKRICKRCAHIIDEFTDLAPIPGEPKRTRLDALIDYVNRENAKTPREKIRSVIVELNLKGHTISAIAKETGITDDAVMLVLMDIEEVD